MQKKTLQKLRQQLTACQIADEHRLRRKLRDLEKRRDKGADLDRRLENLASAIADSRQACAIRAQAIPERIQLPQELPVSSKSEEIAAALKQHQVLVIAGDTGSGKTTQLPKICLQAGLGRRGLIGHTQPRRLAAVSVANRIAEELGCQPGQGVGYQVRFNDHQSPQTYLKVMTDGILLAEIGRDRFLNRYEVIIIDEAHERSLNIDFLLGFLKQLLPRRRDLKVIITSATIDLEKFSRHFADAPVIKVSGRTYPVETRYRPLDADSDDSSVVDSQIEAVCHVVGELASPGGSNNSTPAGDILVFFSGEKEIRESARMLRQQRLPDLEILPLYARLRQSEQAMIFRPHSGRRVVLATNVAETSITVPGIKYVIDTGLARISRYSLQSKVQRLPVEPISQASANQRQGRCGRLSGGICIRLYSEDDFESRPLYTDPEIKRTNLASVILGMRFLRLGEAEEFPFIEPPERKAINEGYKLLLELNALTVARDLTQAGRQMASLPVDPRYARMLVTAASHLCLREVLIIASALSIQDPREVNADNRAQAREKLALFEHPDSDFLGYVKLWDSFEQTRQRLNQNQLRKYCKSHFLSFMRMREWRQVHRQLLLACQQLDMRVNKAEGSYEQIHRAIIAGSLNQIAVQQEPGVYLNNRNRKFKLFTTSVLANKKTNWIVTGELIETAQTFATLAAKIQPEWVEQEAMHLVKREQFQPHWSEKRQEVMAHEKVHLYGLTIIENSTVPYAGIDPLEAREIFIREALVAGGIRTRAPFYRSNQELLEELARTEEKMRRPDLLASERDIFRFYQERIPEDVSSTRRLEGWLKKQDGNATLQMDKQSLLGDKKEPEETLAFPDQAAVSHNQLRINYMFAPGNSADGATIEVPLSILNQLHQGDVDWAVPGLIREKCIALLKGLPKSLRKNFIPVSAFVDEILPHMSSADGDLVTALLGQIRRRKQLKLSGADFASTELPRFLVSKIRVVDEKGKELGFGEDIGQLQKQFSDHETASASGADKKRHNHEIERSGLIDWDLAELPETVELGDELVLLRYPGLVDEQDSVSIRLFSDRQSALEHSVAGLTRLFMLRSIQQRNMLRKQFHRLRDRQALIVPRNQSDLVEDAVTAVYQEAFSVQEPLPADREQFLERFNQGKSVLHATGNKLESLLDDILQRSWAIRSELSELPEELTYLREDIEAQLKRLLTDHFVRDTSFRWLSEFPRFLRSSQERLKKVPHMGPRDKPLNDELSKWWRRYNDLAEIPVDALSTDGIELNWLLEEYRVSVFAQHLGTSRPVSAKRLEKQFQALKD